MTPSFINIAGIVLNRIGLQPLPGVEVFETKTRQRMTTDSNGFFSLQVPAVGDEPGFRLNYRWQGNLLLSSGAGLRPSEEPQGRIQIEVLDTRSPMRHEDSLHSPYYPSPPNPGYEDALRVARLVIKDHEETLRFYAMQKAHPEISRFYVANGGSRRLVLYRDGRVEGYGGPDEPGFSAMDARYAPLPWYMVRMYQHRPDRPSPWEEIARRLQQDFHPLPSDAKAVVFPGDDQAIVVTASGDTECYHLVDIEGMSNPRAEFEARFGKLPGYVPVAVRQPGTNNYEIVFPHGDASSTRVIHQVRTVESMEIETDDNAD